MPGRLLHGQQQKDPKHHVEADEHRPNIVVPVEPARTPQGIEQEVSPKGIEYTHHDQDDLQCALTLHTVLRFGETASALSYAWLVRKSNTCRRLVRHCSHWRLRMYS